MRGIRCQFCGEMKEYPGGEITQESAREVTTKKRRWLEWTSVWRCKRCAEEGKNSYIDVNGDEWEIPQSKKLSREAVRAQTMDTIFDQNGLWSAVEAEEEMLADQRENAKA